ncbi:hypothetical protein ACFLZN_02495 [Nanoarchaeota archaeon]
MKLKKELILLLEGSIKRLKELDYDVWISVEKALEKVKNEDDSVIEDILGWHAGWAGSITDGIVQEDVLYDLNRIYEIAEEMQDKHISIKGFRTDLDNI